MSIQNQNDWNSEETVSHDYLGHRSIFKKQFLFSLFKIAKLQLLTETFIPVVKTAFTT